MPMTDQPFSLMRVTTRRAENFSLLICFNSGSLLSGSEAPAVLSEVSDQRRRAPEFGIGRRVARRPLDAFDDGREAHLVGDEQRAATMARETVARSVSSPLRYSRTNLSPRAGARAATALPESVKRRRIASDTLVVVASANHPLARGSINEATYRAADHVLVSARRRGGGFEDQAIERMGWRRKIGLRCQNLHAACEVVEDSALLLTVAISSARTLASQFGLQILPAPICLPPIELYAYWHALAEGDAANNWLRTSSSPHLRRARERRGSRVLD